MRTLVLADIHGNLAALDAVLSVPHEAVICLGDIVGTGPEPAACVERIRASALAVVRGNHDHAIAARRAAEGPEPFRSLAAATAPLALAQLDAFALSYLGGLPLSVELTLAGRRSLLVHATPPEPLYRATGADPNAWAEELIGVEAEWVFVGHTHVPFDLTVGRQRVVNPGSVGLPVDGDSRAACAVLDEERITLLRVAYPVDRTIEALRRSALAPAARGEAIGWLRSGRPPARRVPLGTAPLPDGGDAPR